MGVTWIGLSGPIPIPSFVPLMLFALLFGLSMDYEVFLLSDVRRRWHQTGDNLRSVREGLLGTGRVITAAAAIMVGVFLAFVPNNDPTIKMFGVGLAVAIAVDATVVALPAGPGHDGDARRAHLVDAPAEVSPPAAARSGRPRGAPAGRRSRTGRPRPAR